ncbi:MAG: DUF6498-containing protein [Candidatus Paceibacterota bacterium]|jgi:hypothetical protein
MKTNDFSPIPRDFSEIFLIVVNLLPLFGVWFLGWNLPDVFILYWAESAIIGFFWFFKLICAFILDKTKFKRFPKLFLFFLFLLIHFGGFMFGHLIAILSGLIFKGKGVELSVMFIYFKDTIITLLIPLALLFISHGVSFVQNFILSQEYKVWIERQDKIKSIPPYGRIIIMHISVFLIAFLMNAGEVWLPLSSLLIIFTKIFTDLRAHRKEHQKVIRQGTI